MPDVEEFHDENTLVKVYKALLDNGIVGQQAVDVVSSMQNEGILFRERVRSRRGRPRGSKNKKTEEPVSEEDRPEKAPMSLTQSVMGDYEDSKGYSHEVSLVDAWAPKE